jgi:hypothetical protein
VFRKAAGAVAAALLLCACDACPTPPALTPPQRPAAQGLVCPAYQHQRLAGRGLGCRHARRAVRGAGHERPHQPAQQARAIPARPARHLQVRSVCVCVCVCVCARVRACRAAGCWALRDRVCGEHVRRPSHTAIGAPGGVFAGCCCRRWASCGSCWWATTTTGSPQPGTCRWWRWSRRTAGALCSLQLTGARACACAVRKCAKVCTRQASRLMCA